jgi:hypothetical protein
MKNLYQFHLQAYLSQNQMADAVRFVLRTYGLEHPNLRQIIIEPSQKDQVLLTARGEVGDPQDVHLPQNLFEVDEALYLNLLAHEMLHVAQKSPQMMVADKNEREWQAYHEMLFHERFLQLPTLSNFYLKFFAEKALVYYQRMPENGALQQQYAQQKATVDELLAGLS